MQEARVGGVGVGRWEGGVRPLPTLFKVSAAPRESLWREVLQGGEGRVAGRGGRHALHLARRVGGGAHAAEAAVQQLRRVAAGEGGREGVQR